MQKWRRLNRAADESISGISRPQKHGGNTDLMLGKGLKQAVSASYSIALRKKNILKEEVVNGIDLIIFLHPNNAF